MGISMKESDADAITDYIVSTPQFQKSLAQKHHKDTTLGLHTLEVKKAAVKICEVLDKVGVKTDVNSVTAAALCHDLGMVGRDELYKNDVECWTKHSKDSVETARELIPDMDEKTEKAIRSHMWPFTKHVPTSREGWILVAADKYASTAGTLRHMLKKMRRGEKS